MPFEIGQAIGNYDIVDVLDATVSGVTYKVRNQLADRMEALKILPSELRQDREVVDRFLREAKIHARLQHPNIASFYSAMEVEGELVMTMELVPGITLEQRLQQGPIPFEQAIDYVQQVLAGLEFAHSHGVAHRNIAPSSIKLASKGMVKIIEFGLAKAVTDPRLTLTGMVLGPMHYLSPEQVKGLPSLDARTDIYSLGMVLYELATGKKAFDSSNQFQVMEAQVRETPKPPSELLESLPKALDRIFSTATAKEPDERYQSAAEFSKALEQITRADEQDVMATVQTSGVADEPVESARASDAPSGMPPLDRLNEDEVATATVPEPVHPAPSHSLSPDAPSPREAIGKPRRPASTTQPSPVARRAERPSQQTSTTNSQMIDPIMLGGITFVATSFLLLLFFLVTR